MSASDTGPCPRCRYIGPRHLCGCMGKLGAALRAGDLPHARELFSAIVIAENRDLRAREDAGQ